MDVFNQLDQFTTNSSPFHETINNPEPSCSKRKKILNAATSLFSRMGRLFKRNNHEPLRISRINLEDTHQDWQINTVADQVDDSNDTQADHLAENPEDDFKHIQLNDLRPREIEKLFREKFSLDKEQFPDLDETRTNIQCVSKNKTNKQTAIFFYPSNSSVAHDTIVAKPFALNEYRRFRLLKKAQTHDVIVRTVNSFDEINKVFSQQNKDIDHVEFGFHGNWDHIEIGSSDDDIIYSENIKEIDFSNLKPYATILLSSCRSGAKRDNLPGDNIACEISKVLENIHVIAPEDSISGQDIGRVRTENLATSIEDMTITEYLQVLINENNSNITAHYINGELQSNPDLDINVNDENYLELSFMDEELRNRFFDYLAKCSFVNDQDEKPTLTDWKNNNLKEKVLHFESPKSSKYILEKYLTPFYKKQRLHNKIFINIS